MIYVFLFCIFIFFMNRMMLRASLNSQNENVKREINRKIIQNRKLDELYGRETPSSPGKEIERAIIDLAKDKSNSI
tara:strand:- start:92 stop:319 length:228 start_codon:yes stop_codon:yes gene_type:complete